MNTTKQEKTITQAVATVRRFGVRLVADMHYGVRFRRGVWQASERDLPRVCICGAIALAENPTNGHDILKAVARKLKITLRQAASLSDGFEDQPGRSGDGDYEVDKVWYRIGRKWRRRADEVGSA